MTPEICAVVSGKGGVGKSTAAYFLANALAGKDTTSVVIDMNIGLRGLEIFFNNETVLYDLGDLVEKRTSNYYDTLMKSSYNKNLFGISAPSNPFFRMNFDSVFEVITNLKKEFDYVILDSPPAICAGYVSAVSVCDRAIVVATPDPLSVKMAEKTSLYLKNADVKTAHLLINGVNFFDRRPPMISDFDSIIDSTGLPLIGVLPFEESIYDSVLKNRMLSRRLGYTKAIFNVAKRYNNEDVPLAFG